MMINVLIVDPEIGFAVPVKRALEQAGDYRISVFVNGKAGLELLQRQPQQVAVLDFRVADFELSALIKAMRRIQPTLTILVSSRTPDDTTQLANLDVQGNIPKPYLARQLITLLGNVENAALLQSRP